MKIFIKLILVLIVLIVVSQLEYKGRKIQTYVEEYVKSLTAGKQEAAPVIEEEKVVPKPKKDVKKKKDMVDIDDKDRKELQNLMEQ